MTLSPPADSEATSGDLLIVRALGLLKIRQKLDQAFISGSQIEPLIAAVLVDFQKLLLFDWGAIVLMDQGHHNSQTLASIGNPDKKSFAIEEHSFVLINGYTAKLRLARISPTPFSTKEKELAEQFARLLVPPLTYMLTQKKLQRQMDELAAYHMVSGAAHKALSLDDLFERITQSIGQRLFTDNIGILVFDPVLQILNNHFSYRERSTRQAINIPLGKGVTGTVAATGKAIRSGNVSTLKDYINADSLTISELCVPLFVRGQLVGVINAESSKPDCYTEEDEQLLDTIATQLGLTIEMLQLREDEEQRRIMTETMRQVSSALASALDLDQILDFILTYVQRIITYDSVAVLLLKNDQLYVAAQRGYRYPNQLDNLEVGKAAHIRQLIATKQPVVIDDTHSDSRWVRRPESEYIRSWLGIPLVVKDTVIGFLSLDKANPDGFTISDAERVVIFANQAAIAIETTQLYEASHKHIRRLNVLANIAMQLNTLQITPAVFENILDATLDILGFNVGWIYLQKNGKPVLIAQRNLPVPADQAELMLHNSGACNCQKKLIEESMNAAQVVQCSLFSNLLNLPGFIESHVSIPIRAETTVFGMVNLCSVQSTLELDADDYATLSGIGHQLAVALSRTALYQETLSRLQRERHLSELSQAISSDLDLQAVLKNVISTSVSLLGADAGILGLITGDDELTPYSFTPNAPTKLVVDWHLPRKKGVGWRVVHSRSVVYLEDYAADPDALGEWVEAGAGAFMGAPVVAGDQCLGVLAVFTLTPGKLFDPNNKELLQAIGNQAGVAIQNARLFEETQNHVLLMERLVSAGERLTKRMTTGQVIELIGESGVSIGQTEKLAIFCRHDNDHVSCPWYQGVSKRYIEQIISNLDSVPGGQMLNSTSEILISDAQHLPDESILRRLAMQEEFHGLALWPMVYQNQVIAALVCYYDAPRFWADTERSLMRTFTRQAAIALENARLFSVTQRRLQQLQALHIIDTTITANLDLRVTLNVLLSQVVAQLGVDAADILLLDPDIPVLNYAAGTGFRGGERYQPQRVRVGEPLAGLAARQRKMIGFGDLRQVEEQIHFLLPPEENIIAYYGVPLLAKGEIKGVLQVYHRGPLFPDNEWLDFLQALADIGAIAVDDAQLFMKMQRSNAELILAYDTTLEGWVKALDLRDNETEGHSKRVMELTLKLARRMGVSEADLVHIRRGALLHDIGKLGIPDRILHKPGPLTEEEWTVVRKHPVYAFELLAPIEYLRPALDIPYCHHERWNGSGYPRGLSRDQIPLPARLFTVVDVWDALRSNRPYRMAWPAETVKQHLVENAGVMFDPRVVQEFLQMIQNQD